MTCHFHAHNAMSTPTNVTSKESSSIHISDALAVLAWRERRDEAAAHWLREKYYPLLVQLGVQLLRQREQAERMVHAAFERGLAAIEEEDALPPLMKLFTGMAFRVCADIQCESAAKAA